MGEFRMPSLGADMDAGTLLEWLVKPGDVVRRGDVVAVIDTAKAAIDVESFEEGVVRRLLVEPGASVPVGTPLAVIGDEAPRGRPASPIVRHLAKERGVDLAAVTGSGPGGAVTRRDVEAAVAPARRRVSPYARRRAAELGVDLAALPDGAVRAADVEAAAPPRLDRGAAMREAIASAMTRSKREIPHYYLATTVDLRRAMSWLERENAARPVTRRLLPAALLLKASALALRTVPGLNGWWTDGAFQPSERVHLGVAIALRPSGLVAPAVHDADTLPLDDLMAALADLGRRARAGSLRGSELADPTATVTNLGDVDVVHAVIHPPQVAIVGFGRVREEPFAEGGLLGVRQAVTATLAADHRVTDGHAGARFLRALADLLSRPEEL